MDCASRREGAHSALLRGLGPSTASAVLRGGPTGSRPMRAPGGLENTRRWRCSRVAKCWGEWLLGWVRSLRAPLLSSAASVVSFPLCTAISRGPVWAHFSASTGMGARSAARKNHCTFGFHLRRAVCESVQRIGPTRLPPRAGGKARSGARRRGDETNTSRNTCAPQNRSVARAG